MVAWLKEVLFVITHPNFWVMEYAYNPVMDQWLDAIMTEDLDIQSVSEYSVEFVFKNTGIYSSVWVGNYPYSFGQCHSVNCRYRASRVKIYQFKKWLVENYLYLRDPRLQHRQLRRSLGLGDR